MSYCQQRQCIKVTSVTISGGTMILNTGITGRTICNGEKNVVCICAPIPASTTVVPVVLNINGVNIAMQDYLGNVLQSDQIRCRQAYVGVWGTLEPIHFKLCTCTKRSQAAALSVTPATAGTTEEAEVNA